jgi:hypothetical protein
LFVRRGDDFEDAPAEDVEVASKYPECADKGPLRDGTRLTILTAKDKYRVGEEIRVIHVVEVVEPGGQVYISGPKPVYGEYVDGKLATKPLPKDMHDDPLVPLDYDGPTLLSPADDYNYDVTAYTFSKPGRHKIQWHLGALRSNTLEIDIAK